MFKKILIPMDDSELGREALQQGLALAKLSGGEVTILYAIETPYELVSDYGQLEQAQAHKARAKKVLQQISTEARSRGIPTQAIIVEQHPVPAILEAAKEHDLVVMATHGRKGVERVLMGSVTDKVLHNCSTSILVVRSAPTQ